MKRSICLSCITDLYSLIAQLYVEPEKGVRVLYLPGKGGQGQALQDWKYGMITYSRARDGGTVNIYMISKSADRKPVAGFELASSIGQPCKIMYALASKDKT